jgi:hypothetical protein
VYTAHHVSSGEVRWRVIPLETPRISRHCSNCGITRQFTCSNNFRLNANQRKIDVWLIYRCGNCDSTWNCTIFTRSAPEEIGAELYRHLQDNDRETAWRYAFDLARLRRLGVCVDAAVPVWVERVSLGGVAVNGGGQTIFFELPYPCEVRLDKLLAGELCVSRSSIQHWFDQGVLHVWPADKHALRKPVRNGQVIALAVAPDW